MKKLFFRRESALYIAITVAACIVYGIGYGFKTLDPTNINWLMSAYHDWGQHYLGWAYYRNEPWHWPLGRMDNFYAPVGTNVGFTDSIPLLALLFKPFSALLPDDFQYFGFWLLFCHIAVAWYTVRILKLYKTDDWICFLAAVFITANPVLIFRGLHPALCGHWLVMASIYYCLKEASDPVVAKRLEWKQAIIFFLSAGVSAYLALMVAGFTIVLPLRHYLVDKSIRWWSAVLFPAGAAASVLGFWLAFGMIETGPSTNLDAGYANGEYGFNLLSFFDSYGYYSRFLPKIGTISDRQYEGFAYLGLGFMLVLAVAAFVGIVMIFREKRKVSKGMLLVVGLCSAYTVFAITNYVSFGTHVLFHFPVPTFYEKLLGTFRASGRFVWPLYYLIMLGGILVFSRMRLNKLLVRGLLMLLLALQVYDTWGLLTARQLPSGEYYTKLKDTRWINLMSQFDMIVTYPVYTNNLVYPMDYQDLMFLALKAGKPITNGYVARENRDAATAYADKLSGQITMGTIAPGQLFITNETYLADFSSLLYRNKVTVKRMGGFVILYAKRSGMEPYFDKRPENVRFADSVAKSYAGQRNLFRELPEANAIKKDILLGVERLKFANNVLSVNGWAMVKGSHDNTRDSLFVAIIGKKTFLAPVAPVTRADISATYGGKLDNAGFRSTVILDKLPRDTYDFGIAIRDSNGAYHLAVAQPIKQAGYAKKPERIYQLSDTPLLYNMEEMKQTGRTLSMSGWAVVKGQSSDANTISLVLLGEHNYRIATDFVARPDVTAGNPGYNYDRSGFRATVNTTDIEQGRYQIAIMIVDGDTKKEHYALLGRTVQITK